MQAPDRDRMDGVGRVARGTRNIMPLPPTSAPEPAGLAAGALAAAAASAGRRAPCGRDRRP